MKRKDDYAIYAQIDRILGLRLEKHIEENNLKKKKFLKDLIQKELDRVQHASD